MGFGLLLLGYIFLCNFGVESVDTKMAFDFFPDVIGWILMLIGLIKLSRYARILKGAAITAAVMIPISLYSILCGFQVLGFMETESDIIYKAVVYLSIIALPVFHYFMTRGVREILLSCNNLEKPAKFLKASFITVTVSSALSIILKLNKEISLISNKKALEIINPVNQIFYAAWLLMGAYALLKAFFSVTETDKK